MSDLARAVILVVCLLAILIPAVFKNRIPWYQTKTTPDRVLRLPLLPWLGFWTFWLVLAIIGLTHVIQ